LYALSRKPSKSLIRLSPAGEMLVTETTYGLMPEYSRLPFLLVFSADPISAHSPHITNLFNGCNFQAACHAVLFLC
jgi:hypothetical protein